MPTERVLPLPAALTRGMAAVAALGLEPEFASLGREAEPTAFVCRLRTADGTMPPMAQGVGKGRRLEARVGALFEALEHYLTGPACFDPATVEAIPGARVLAGPLRDEASALLLASAPDRPLACHRYRSMAADEQDLLVPLYLSAPWYVERQATRLRARAADAYDYRELMRYSCNSGSAIGVTAAEALLHALNEAIERDAFSLLLVRAFLSAAGSRLRTLDPGTLPEDSRRAHAAAQRLTGAPVHLLDITSDLGVPTVLAYVPPLNGVPHRRGTGTSLCPAYALWRALTELLQRTFAQAGTRAGADLAGLAAHPALHACGRFDLTDHLCAAETIPFTPARGALGPPAQQVRELVAMVTARGYRPYYRLAAELPGDVTVVHAIVPGLERFMLVTEGNLVLPGPRGRADLPVTSETR
ncbi:YcaO-like family protein [Nonomuraea sp. NPDC046802]|uniref:YcaO-like family protein n=1 Tax=Nonomuraea sp. NPDC046802 TaxID=3154919 RepID=UPI0033CA2266